MTKKFNAYFAIIFLTVCLITVVGGSVLPDVAAADTAREFKRTVNDLEDQSENLKDEVEAFLRDEDEWEPKGKYEDLWDEVTKFNKQSVRLTDWVRDEEPVRELEELVNRMEDTTDQIDDLLRRVDASRRVEREWDDALDLLKDVRRQLGDGFAYGTSESAAGTQQASSNMSTQQADFAVNIIEDRSERMKNAFAESGKENGVLGQQLALFDQRANKLQDTYFDGRNPASFLPVLKAMRAQQQQISDLVSNNFGAGPVQTNWNEITNQLDALARNYGL
ncbi:MAG: hypothetical protein OEU36_10110 [Gammaproteobacteria bacterium]|nr:hypothetical protein [Gammaproteobacteria bacterium]